MKKIDSALPAKEKELELIQVEKVGLEHEIKVVSKEIEKLRREKEYFISAASIVTKDNTLLKKKGANTLSEEDSKSIKMKITEFKQNAARNEILVKAQNDELSEIKRFYKELCEKHGLKFNKELISLGKENLAEGEKSKEPDKKAFEIATIPDEYETGKVTEEKARRMILNQKTLRKAHKLMEKKYKKELLILTTKLKRMEANEVDLLQQLREKEKETILVGLKLQQYKKSMKQRVNQSLNSMEFQKANQDDIMSKSINFESIGTIGSTPQKVKSIKPLPAISGNAKYQSQASLVHFNKANENAKDEALLREIKEAENEALIIKPENSSKNPPPKEKKKRVTSGTPAKEQSGEILKIHRMASAIIRADIDSRSLLKAESRIEGGSGGYNFFSDHIGERPFKKTTDYDKIEPLRSFKIRAVVVWKLKDLDKFSGIVFHYEDDQKNMIEGEYPSDFSEKGTVSSVLEIAEGDALDSIEGLFNNDHLTYIELKTKKGESKTLGKGNSKKDGCFSIKINPETEIILPLYEVIMDEEKKIYYNILYDFKVVNKEGIMTRSSVRTQHLEESMMELISQRESEIERMKEEIKITETVKLTKIKEDQLKLKREVDELKNDVISFDIKRQEVMGEIQSWKGKIKEQDDKISQVELEKAKIEVMIGDKSQDLDGIKDEAKIQERRIQDKDAECDRLKDKKRKCEILKKEKEDEIERSLQEKKNLERLISEKQTLIQKIEKRLLDKTRDKETQESKGKDKEKMAEEWRGILKEHEKDIEDYTFKINEKEENIKEMDRRLKSNTEAEIKNKIKDKDKEIEDLRRKLQDFEKAS